MFVFLHFVGLGSALLALLFLINNFLIFVMGAPGVINTVGLTEFFGTEIAKGGYTNPLIVVGFIQTALFFLVIIFAGYHVSKNRDMRADARWLDKSSAYFVRAAFWAVFIIGLADAVLSFLRVEGLHTNVFGEDIAAIIALPAGRGMYFHLPLLVLAFLIALRDRSVSLIWLAFLVVIAEFLIVIARFIYGYEQTFMGDLVRFWYAALFLFASAYTLKEDGHVRVDVIYAGLKEKTKCVLNSTGAIFFGIPLCWLILLRGLWGKSSLINSPMLNFETSMSGFGMYIKYFMAAFLIVFAFSMLLQFTSYLFASMAKIEEGTFGSEQESGAA